MALVIDKFTFTYLWYPMQRADVSYLFHSSVAICTNTRMDVFLWHKNAQHTITVQYQTETIFLPSIYAIPWLVQCKRRKLVIMQVDDFALFGGMERMVIDLSLYLRRQGYHVWLLNLGQQGDAMKRIQEEQFFAVNIRNEREYMTLATRADVIFAHYSIQYACKTHRMVQVLHNQYFWLQEQQKLKQWQQVDDCMRYACVSQAVCKYSKEVLRLENVQDAPIIHNVIDTSMRMNLTNSCNISDSQSLLHIRRYWREMLNIPHDSLVLVQVAAISPIKGQAFVIEAMKQILSKNVHFVMIGKTIDRQYEVAMLRSAYFADMYNRVHQLTDEKNELACILTNMDTYIHVSLTEGYSLAIEEAVHVAMQMNKSVQFIVSDTGATRVQVKNVEHTIIQVPQNWNEMPSAQQAIGYVRDIANAIEKKSQKNLAFVKGNNSSTRHKWYEYEKLIKKKRL